MAVIPKDTAFDTITVVKQNGRLGSKKRRTGCLTCKARKVRCDERHPHCLRCINAGRECRGYADVFVSNQVFDVESESDGFSSALTRSSSSSPSRSPSPPSDAFECRALQYYQLNVAAILGGAVDTEFWTKSVLQLCQTEPPVKQALVAVSSAFELQARNDQWNFTDAQQRSAEVYAKALVTTAQRVAEPNAEVVALATCVLFLCLHCLEGRKDQAVRLLRSGSGVMQKVLSGLRDPSAFNNDPVAAIFLPIFERKLVLLRMFGEALPHLRDSTSLLADDFEERFSNLNTLDDARTALHWLIAETHDLVAISNQHRYVPEADETHLHYCIQRQSVQLAAYEAWLEGFNKLCAKHGPALDTRQTAFLRVSYRASVVWLSTSLLKDERMYENYTKDFKAIVCDAEEVVQDQPPSFTFEMGLIPSLHLTAIKCRVPWIRRKAIALLRLAPVREGLWNRDETIRLDTRRIDLESSDSEIVGNRIVFQDAKICDVKANYTDENGTHVTFYSKLDGHGEIWEVWDEVIPIWYGSSPEA